MTAKPFPTHFWVILNPKEQWDLHELFDQDPHLIDEFELVHKALAKGITVMQHEYRANRDPHNLTRTDLSAPEASSARQSALGKRSHSAARHRHVENYLGVPIGELLRERLESALSEHPEMGEETFYAVLLDLGLQKLGEEPDAPDPSKVTDDLESPLSIKVAARREHRARWLALCRSVARGWR